MRKLATVMAAALLIAGLFALSVATAYAGNPSEVADSDIVILKCAQKITHTRGVFIQTSGNADRPALVAEYSQSSIPGNFSQPSDCDLEDSCAECLSVLINNHDCGPNGTFVKGPIVLSTILNPGPGIQTNAENQSLGLFEYHSLSEYVFQCGVPRNE